MTFADTGTAIGAVTGWLKASIDRVAFSGNNKVSAGRPETLSSTGSSNDYRLNIFLYEVQFDGSMNGAPAGEGADRPVWLVLKYLMTAFDGGESDNEKAHGYLGEGIRALQELSFLTLGEDDCEALRDNPEELKITFENLPVDTLSKILQGTGDKYRVSIGFQVRPVMIAPSKKPSYPELVGVKYTTDPATIIGEKGIGTVAVPVAGPTIEDISPPGIEPGPQGVTVRGHGLDVPGLSVELGPVTMPVAARTGEGILLDAGDATFPGDRISAGCHPIRAVQALPGGRRRSGNAVMCRLLPRLDRATYAGGTIVLNGSLLGGESDDIILALYRDGEVAEILEELRSADASQKVMSHDYKGSFRGRYRLVLVVNGQQARNRPEVEIQ